MEQLTLSVRNINRAFTIRQRGGVMKLTKTFVLALLLCVPAILSGQTKWYKFSKAFIAQHYSGDSAIGPLQVNEAHPAHTVHSVSCGGNDGELHIGIPGDGVVWPNPAGEPISALADETSNDFGVVAEPPNVRAAL